MAKNRLEFEAHLSRHSHNLDAGYTASLAPGMIIPQYFDILQPGESVYYNTKMFARLQDVVTAFLGEIDVHVDYFFVPLQMIYTPFGQIYAQTNDFLTSLYSDLDKSSFPLFNIQDWNSNPFIGDSEPAHVTLAGHDENLGKEYIRLYDAFDLNPLAAYSRVSSLPETEAITKYFNQPAISPWIPAAYQAIYQKFFRNDDLEKLNVSSYNIDAFWNQSLFYQSDFMTLRFVQRPSDYFTTSRPSPISSAINSMGAINTPNAGVPQLSDALQETNNWLGSNGSTLARSTDRDFEHNTLSSDPTYDETNFPNAFRNMGIGFDSNGSEKVTVANIRTMFALDKFLRIYGRAGKTYDAQIEAHFGIKIPHDVKHDATRLKSYHFVLQSDPVYSTTNVQNTQDPTSLVSTIGQVGGQSVGELNTLNSDPEKFTAPVHGVFMAVAYAVTKPRYWGTYSKLHELTDRLSFPIPEFDKLGAQPLFAHEINPRYLSSEAIDNRCGWQNRYQQFKKKYNRCSILYADFGSNFDENDGFPVREDDYGDNIYAPWVISRLPMRDTSYASENNSAFLATRNFFERATALDPIMVQRLVTDWQSDWGNHPYLALQSDPILTEFYCKCKKVSWMSETGEPDL